VWLYELFERLKTKEEKEVYRPAKVKKAIQGFINCLVNKIWMKYLVITKYEDVKCERKDTLKNY